MVIVVRSLKNTNVFLWADYLLCNVKVQFNFLSVQLYSSNKSGGFKIGFLILKKINIYYENKILKHEGRMCIFGVSIP